MMMIASFRAEMGSDFERPEKVVGLDWFMSAVSLTVSDFFRALENCKQILLTVDDLKVRSVTRRASAFYVYNIEEQHLERRQIEPWRRHYIGIVCAEHATN